MGFRRRRSTSDRYLLAALIFFLAVILYLGISLLWGSFKGEDSGRTELLIDSGTAYAGEQETFAESPSTEDGECPGPFRKQGGSRRGRPRFEPDFRRIVSFSQEALTGLAISLVFLTTFAVAEWMRIGWGVKVETTRKFVHLVGGLVSLSFSYLFESYWTLLILCGLFVALIFGTRRMGWLPSIHNIERSSSGALYHPLGIFVSFCAASRLGRPEFYLIAVLVLAISDSIAALIGSAYGFKLYQVQEDRKSIEGSVMFFVSTFLIVHLCLLLLTPIGRLESVLCGILIAFCVTLFEAISLGGADNLFIPWGTMLILSKVTDMAPDRLLNQFWILSVSFLLVMGAAMPSQKFSRSGFLGLALFAYAAHGMIGFEWFVPVLIGTVLISTTDLFIGKPKGEGELNRIRPVFYSVGVSVIWILVAGFAREHRHVLVMPFLVGMLGQFSILWKWRRRELLATLGKLSPGSLQGQAFVGRAVLLTLLFIPWHLLLNFVIVPWFSVLTCFCGILLCDRIYWFLCRRFGRRWNQSEHLHYSMAVVMLVTLGLGAANLVFYGVML